ncbi:hypothetical protein E4T56_gene5754, partial [Termitomyces sp. T112]
MLPPPPLIDFVKLNKYEYDLDMPLTPTSVMPVVVPVVDTAPFDDGRPFTPINQDDLVGDANGLDAVCHQENCELPLEHKPPPPLPPSPYPKVPPEQLLWDVNIGNADDHGEQEVDLALNMSSDEALLLAGHMFVEHGLDFGGFSMV